jgi:ankyrin repeat protein
MLHAIRTNRTEVVKILLDNFKSTPPNDVFFEAIIAGNSEAVKLLLEYGADIVAKAPDTRRGVLHEAVRRRLPDLVAYLLSQGADSCDTDNSGRTPLFDAIEVGDTSSIRQLLQYGVDIEAVDTRTGRQALHEAAINGNEEILLMIVNQLLKLDCRDNAGKTPLDYARENRHTKIFGILLARTKDVPEYAVSIQDSPIPTYDFPDKSLARRLTKTWSPDSQPRLEASAT